jgi:hypothetical protein
MSLQLQAQLSESVGRHLVWSRPATDGEAFFRVEKDWVFAVAPTRPELCRLVEEGAEVVGVVFSVANASGAQGFVVEVRSPLLGSLGLAPAEVTARIVRYFMERGEGVLSGSVLLKECGRITVKLVFFSSAADAAVAPDEWVVFDRLDCVISVLDVDVNALGGKPH